MATKLKPIDEQVVVITGPSSGIGLATAQLAASRGARLVLASRSDAVLGDLVEFLGANGTQVISVHCDVADRDEVEGVGRAAIARFGRIDTWVNNAGVGMYGRLDLTDEDDARRLFDVNFWGVVHGSMVALRYLRTNGGAIVNVGSEVSEATAPLIGIYAASKHAVKAFTDTLRIEVEEIDHSPVSITLVEPTGVDTPFPHHARNFMACEPKLPGKPIEPARVAEAILDAATSHSRVKRVGAMATVNTATARFAPGLAQRLSVRLADEQRTDEPPRHPEGVLHKSSAEAWLAGHIRGVH
jgi:short-subunit dehydrogenase